MKLKKRKLTPWFRTTVTPVRVGIYQRKPSGVAFYSYWDGTNWYMGALTPYVAECNYKEKAVSLFQKAKWRGIAQQSI